MIRRLFLAQPILHFTTNTSTTPKLVPVNTKLINSNDTVFVSKNGRLTIQSVYDDYGSCVAVTNMIEWDDPVTKTKMKKFKRELYMLKYDNM
jgi:hypothetical protein